MSKFTEDIRGKMKYWFQFSHRIGVIGEDNVQEDDVEMHMHGYFIIFYQLILPTFFIGCGRIIFTFSPKST